MQTIYLDVSKKGELQKLYVKQLDNDRKFAVVVTDNGDPYPVAEDALLSVWYSGTCGRGNYSSVGGESAFSVEENVITVEFSPSILAHSGAGTLALIINDRDGAQIGLWNVLYYVEAVAGVDSDEPEESYTAFAELVSSAAEYADRAEEAARKLTIDDTLSEPGQAADAASVGDALEGKASAGLSEGTIYPYDESELDGYLSEKYLTMADNAVCMLTVCPGSELFSGYPVLAIIHKAYTAGMLSKYATATFIGCGCGYQRWAKECENGLWGPLEWYDPPMVAGIEYRTTERHDGKPVYTMLVDCGLMPENGRKDVVHGLNDPKIIRVAGCLSSHENMPADWETSTARVYASGKAIYIHATGTEFTGLTAVAQLWYIKSNP